MIDLDILSGSFHLAAKREFQSSRLWSMLSERIAEDPDALAVARFSNPEAFPPYLLMSAVHSLLLEDPACPLARFFPTVSRRPAPDEDPYPLFKDFVIGSREKIELAIHSAHVNKTVVKRSACLRALLVTTAREKSWERVHLVDVGCGVGLNLLLDHWQIAYGGGGEVGPADASVRFSIEIRGGIPPPLGGLPVICTRTGIDLDRLDMKDAAQERWILGSLFPDHSDIFDLTKKAINVVRAEPPNFVIGNAGTELPTLLAALPESDPVVIMHSLALFQMTPECKRSVNQAIQRASQLRPVMRIGMEILGNTTALIIADPREGSSRVVGEADYDACWMRWL
jgi:hypothetical protein